ncbi:PH domain-containing protein [Lentibacillus sediminis]|uniref:PH domain-containing protein n=1 Tax=Lentibacillus sediminis TaxID=1940529 RepID=UPI000C1BE6C4|nr:PH domain-containing protein [Lentibacillus sediminis]
MTEARRYHPVQIIYDLWQLIKNSFFFILILFVFQAGSDAWWVTYGKYALLAIIVLRILYIFLKWLTHKYALTATAFELTEGIFSKKRKTVPYAKVQHIKRETKLFHRIFRVTSITFETGSQGEESAVTFHVVSREEADRLEKEVSQRSSDVIEVDETEETEESELPAVEPDRTVHFHPTKKDVIKASFTSLSFLAVIPIGGSLLSKLEDTFQMEQQTEGFFSAIFQNWWLIVISAVILLVLLIAGGMIWTFIKYGKYEIASDQEKVYITKGVLEETPFSITKQNVQAIKIEQSLMKRILGLAEVKLVCAGGMGEDSADVNSLYPFLPVRKAHQLIVEILRTYEITDSMQRLPRKAFWLRMLTPSWFWIIATVILYFWKPDFLGLSEYWWALSIVLLILVVISRVLDYKHTSYTINDQFIQLRSGGFTTSFFLSKRNRLIEVGASRSIFQKKMGLASLAVVNRAKPVLHSTIADVPDEWADTFFAWYKGRRRELEIR